MTNKISVKCPVNLKFLQPQIVNDLSRIGSLSDGGYAITTKALSNADYFLSLGLGENWSFECAISEIKPSALIDIYDNTVSLRFFVAKAFKGLIKLILFKDSFANLASRFSRLTNYFRFWLQSSKRHHHKVHINKQTFEEILSSYRAGSRIGLKVDIEGSEWEILEIISRNCLRFEYILIEVHDFENHESELREFLHSLEADFVNAHLHANNFEPLGVNGFPRVFELTLLRRSSGQSSSGKRKQLPVSGLDVPNAKNRPDFQIDFL
jgi:hypothetical protein